MADVSTQNPSNADPFASANEDEFARLKTEKDAKDAARKLAEQIDAAKKQQLKNQQNLTLDPVLIEAQENETTAKLIEETQDDFARRNAELIEIENLQELVEQSVRDNKISDEAQEAIQIDREQAELALHEIRGTDPDPSHVTLEQKAQAQEVLDGFEEAVARTVEHDIRKTEGVHIASEKTVNTETRDQRALRENEEARIRQVAVQLAAAEKALLLKRHTVQGNIEHARQAQRGRDETDRTPVPEQPKAIEPVKVDPLKVDLVQQERDRDPVKQERDRLAEQPVREPNGANVVAELERHRLEQQRELDNGGPGHNDPNNPRFKRGGGDEEGVEFTEQEQDPNNGYGSVSVTTDMRDEEGNPSPVFQPPEQVTANLASSTTNVRQGKNPQSVSVTQRRGRDQVQGVEGGPRFEQEYHPVYQPGQEN